MTHISFGNLETDKATLKVSLYTEIRKETPCVVTLPSHVQQLLVHLVQHVVDITSSVYDGGGRQVQSEERTQLRNLINGFRTISRACEGQHTDRCCRGSIFTATGGRMRGLLALEADDWNGWTQVAEGLLILN